MIEASYAPLSATLIRRPPPPADAGAIRITLSSPLGDDIRLFAFTWAAGFSFFLAFVA